MKNKHEKTTLKVNKTSRGIALKDKLAKLMETGAGIERISEPIYAENYMPACDIRTDRWDIALDGLIKGEEWAKRKSNVAKGLNPDGTEKKKVEPETV